MLRFRKTDVGDRALQLPCKLIYRTRGINQNVSRDRLRLTGGYWCVLKGLTFKVKKSKTPQSLALTHNVNLLCCVWKINFSQTFI